MCNFIAQVQRTINQSTYSISPTLTDAKLSATLTTAGWFGY